MAPIDTFIRDHGLMFRIERNNRIISEVKGLPNHEKSTQKKYIGFFPSTDIGAGDWLINPSNERLYITDIATTYFHSKANQLKAFYQSEAEYRTQSTSATNIFNIGTATGSVIGSQASVTLNYHESMQKMNEQIDSTDSDDKEELRQIASLLEMIVNNQIPATKGLLSKFSTAMERNSWITSSISSTMIGWLTSQIH